MSEWCHSGVTVVSQCCYSGIVYRLLPAFLGNSVEVSYDSSVKTV
jgi:hypothetical protein